MRGYGYNRSTEEINTRIKNLKCLYNRIKKDLDSGLLNEPSWKHYQAMDEILSRPVFGNNNNNSSSATNSNKVPVINNKIIISPSSVINGNSQSIQDPNQLVQVKEEELSDGDVAMVHSHDEHTENNVDYEDNELRPEDLLSVVDADEEKSSIQIKEEPVDISTINEKHDEEHIKKVQFDNEKDIVNYPNDSLLSITSVQSNGTQQSNSNIIQIPPNSASSTVASKLSLVPTKLLLKSQANFAATTTSSSITTNAQSSIPMKVVFVNTLNNNAQQAVVQKQQNPQQITLNTHSSPNSTFISNKIITAGQTAAQPTKVHLVNQMPSPNYHSTSATSISNVTSSNNSNGHYRHNSSGISKNKSEKSSSKSLLGSNKLPGKTIYYFFTINFNFLINSYKKSPHKYCGN